MDKILDNYTVATATSILLLKKEVNDLMELGYEPCGHLFYEGHGHHLFYQPMVLPHELKTYRG